VGERSGGTVLEGPVSPTSQVSVDPTQFWKKKNAASLSGKVFHCGIREYVSSNAAYRAVVLLQQTY
jgi:hypothetical protein